MLPISNIEQKVLRKRLYAQKMKRRFIIKMKKVCLRYKIKKITAAGIAAMGLASMVMAANPVSAASGEVGIDETNFPDEGFRTYVAENFDSDKNSVLSEEEMNAVEKIDVSDLSYEISSLEGIEFFPNLTFLNCREGKLENLDVSNNTKLVNLYCYDNMLTSLDVSANTMLEILDCSHNSISELDVRNNTALTNLYCSYNMLTDLNVSLNTALKTLMCEHNEITNIDVSSNTGLKTLLLTSNELEKIDLSANTKLTVLGLVNNNLGRLDVSNNTSLEQFAFFNNEITEIDLTGLKSLEELTCSANKLTSLDVSANTALLHLGCAYNNFAGLDLTNNTLLYSFVGYRNTISLPLCADNGRYYVDFSDVVPDTARITNLSDGDYDAVYGQAELPDTFGEGSTFTYQYDTGMDGNMLTVKVTISEVVDLSGTDTPPVVDIPAGDGSSLTYITVFGALAALLAVVLCNRRTAARKKTEI